MVTRAVDSFHNRKLLGSSHCGHRSLFNRLEQRPEAFCVDRNGRIHYGKTLSLPPDSGENSARLHGSEDPKTEEIAIQFFRGQYTGPTRRSVEARKLQNANQLKRFRNRQSELLSDPRAGAGARGAE
jgi:hypothetical protein